MSTTLSQKVPTEFDEIDFKEIEYKNEYSYGRKAAAGLVTSLATFGNTFRVWNHMPWWLALIFSGMVLSAYALGIFFILIKVKSKLLITGNGLTLKRPILPDIEIPYSEVGSMEFKNPITRTSNDGDLNSIQVKPRQPRSGSYKSNSVVIKSIDGKRKIAIDQTLENFEQFCRDLSTRKQLAEERYQGYARGSMLKQPQRTSDLRAALESAAKK